MVEGGLAAALFFGFGCDAMDFGFLVYRRAVR